MILLTGCAGFIGFHTSLALLAQGHRVIGVDNVNAYYDTRLKRDRLAELQKHDKFIFVEQDIAASTLDTALAPHLKDVTHIVHLAAQAGVRHSLDHPIDYGHSNLMGHLRMLELARSAPNLKHFLYASSSSVYGDGQGEAQSIDDRTDAPLSLYAATKKANEAMTHAYAHLYNLKATGLRFFTVYGPWGRPDMAYYSFAQAMVAGHPITVFGKGELRRDFTYIDDIVAGILALLDKIPDGHRVLNLGNRHPETVSSLVALLEKHLGVKARIEHAPRAASDPDTTFADIAETTAICGYEPRISLDEGIGRFATWFKGYHG